MYIIACDCCSLRVLVSGCECRLAVWTNDLCCPERIVSTRGLSLFLCLKTISNCQLLAEKDLLAQYFRFYYPFLTCILLPLKRRTYHDISCLVLSATWVITPLPRLWTLQLCPPELDGAVWLRVDQWQIYHSSKMYKIGIWFMKINRL